MARGHNIGDEIKEQRAKLKYMSMKERIGYIWHYYRYHILWTIFGIILAVNLINEFVFKKQPTFTCGFVNTIQGPANSIGAETLKQAFIDTAEIDETKDTLFFDTELKVYYDAAGFATDTSYASVAKLFTSLGSGEMDAFISNQTELDSYGGDGVFQSMELLLDADLFAKLESENLVHYCTLYDNSDSLTKIPVGIDMTGNKKLTESGLYDASDELYFSIPNAADNKELAVKLLLFLLDL